MQRRAYERIPVKLDVRFYCNDKECSGTVMNLSENGLLINAKMDFPFDMNFELFIPWDRKILKVPVKITRLEKTGDNYNGLSVQVQKMTDGYLKLVESIKSDRY
jgi:c-di-GMP-binding flagellar brake protein YcgR